MIISKPIKYYVYNYIWPRQAEDGQTNTNGSPCPNTRKLFCVTPAQRGLGKYYLFLFSSFYSTWSTDIMNTPNTPYWTQPEHFQYQTTTQDSRAVNEPLRSFTVPRRKRSVPGPFPCGKILTNRRPHKGSSLGFVKPREGLY